MLELADRRAQSERGAVAILMVFVTILAVALLAFVADLGRAMAERRSAQTAADLAALAGGQDLPNTAAARVTVRDYLNENGWPAANASDLTDGTLANGEVQFENGDTKIRVWTPKQEVTYFFGPAAAALLGGTGDTSVDIGAKAAVEIRSALGVLPFVVGAGVKAGAAECLTDPPPGAESACPGPDSGNFGSARVGRADGSGSSLWLERNVKFGLDHNPSAFDAKPPYGDGYVTSRPDIDTALSPFPIGETCKKPATPTGAIFDVDPWTNEFNCIETDPGLVGFEDGLITFSETKTDDCDGRIGGAASGDRVSGCFLTPNRWDDYEDSGDIDIAVVNDPRFGFVPRVWKNFNDGEDPPGGGSKDYAVIGFYGAYITDLYIKKGAGVVKCVDLACNKEKPEVIVAELFDLNRLSQPVYPNAGPTGAYIGYGPKIPVLVE